MLKEATRSNVALWADCVAGAVPLDDSLVAIEAAGLTVKTVRNNASRFISPRVQEAADRNGVTSVSVLAVKR